MLNLWRYGHFVCQIKGTQNSLLLLYSPYVSEMSEIFFFWDTKYRRTDRFWIIFIVAQSIVNCFLKVAWVGDHPYISISFPTPSHCHPTYHSKSPFLLLSYGIFDVIARELSSRSLELVSAGGGRGTQR